MEDVSIFTRVLDLLEGLPPEYKLSGIAITLLFFVAWRILTSKAFVSALDRLFNSRIEQANLYRLLRLSLFSATLFSVVVVTLAFASPLLQGIIENFRISTVMAANAELRARNYDEARRLYERALPNAPDEASLEEIRGLITATYYGQGLHREGLDFICNLYRKRGPGDFRYLFAVQAHLRALRKKSPNDDSLEAESLAAELRDKCDRPDFSEMWASIPFGLMEDLRKGDLIVDHPYRLSDTDRARLTHWVERKTKESTLGMFSFGDYALYFLGEWDRALRDYPKSPIREATLLDAGAQSAWPRNANYLLQFVAEFPRDPRVAQAYMWLVSIYTNNGKRDLAIEAAKRVGELGDQIPLWPILTPAQDAARKLAASGDFAAAHQTLAQICNIVRKHGLECPAYVQKERDLFASIADRIARATNPDDCGPLSYEIRKAGWTLGARAYLEGCLPRVDFASVEYGRNLYRLASESRQVGDYGASLGYLQRFVREIPDHPLLDDVYVELGWHYLLIESNWPLAQLQLQTVLQRFADRNAYDNALWWLAIGAKRNGEYVQAISIFAQIGALSIESRFKQWAPGEAQLIAQMRNFAPLNGPAFVGDPGNPYSGLITTRVAIGSEAHLLGVRAGDRLTSVCRSFTSDVNGMLAAASRAMGTSECEIAFTRGGDRILYVGAGPRRHTWRSSRDAVASPVRPPSRIVPDVPSIPSSPIENASGPSFNCAGFLTAVEKAICADPQLSYKDRKMSALYAQLKAGLSGSSLSNFVGSQRDWLHQRARCREPNLRACISQLYDLRIAEFERRLGQVANIAVPTGGHAPLTLAATNRKADLDENASLPRAELSAPTVFGAAASCTRSNCAGVADGERKATQCLNIVSLAKSKSDSDWRALVPTVDRDRCAIAIQESH